MIRFSLQKQLLKSTLMTTILLGVLGFFTIAFILIFDENNIFDELLELNAAALLNDNARQKIESSLQYLNEQMDIEYQILNREGIILNKTISAPETPYLMAFDNDSYYTVYKSNQWWRVYILFDQNVDKFVQIAQPYQQRIEFVLPKLLQYFFGLLLFLIILILVNAKVIKKSLSPLNQLQQTINQTTLNNLSPITPNISLIEIEPLITAINELFIRLKNASLAQERFVADASHELRTPLSAILMKIQLIERQVGNDSPLTTQLTKLKADAVRATNLTESLLALARLDNESTTSTLHTEPIVLIDFLTNLVHTAQIKYPNTQFILENNQNNQSLIINANATLLTSVVYNLFENAMRYRQTDDTIVIKIYIKTSDNHIHIIIKDNGKGVNASDRERLAERFFRVLDNDKAGGSGLGLSIVAKIMDWHGGKLDFLDGLDNGLGGVGLGVQLTFTNR